MLRAGRGAEKQEQKERLHLLTCWILFLLLFQVRTRSQEMRPPRTKANGTGSHSFTFVRGAHLADVMESGIKRSAAAAAEAAGATETSRLARTDRSLDRGSPAKSNDSR